jgi:predicted site-specific integrase-resolvase
MEYTVKEFAAKERVTERTVYNWLNKGAVLFRRTPSGRVRIQDGSSLAVIFDMKCSEVSGSSNT